MSLKADFLELFALKDSPVRWPIALQAAVAMGLPTVGFALAGRGDLGLLASSGAFIALYLTGRSRRDRALLLPLIGAGLILASVLGVLASGSLALSLTALFLVVVVSSVLCLGFSVGPPGVLFFVLVTGVSSHLAAAPALEGAGLPGGLVVGMLSVGVVIAYAVVLVPLVLPRVRARDAAHHSARTVMTFEIDEVTRIIIVRLIVACGVAALVAAPLGIHRAYWVLIAVVAILQNGHRFRLTALRGAHRVLGTLAGLGLFALLSLLHPSGVWLGLVLAALQFLVEIVVIRNYGLALFFITPLALTIAAQGRTGEVGAIVVDRVVDTVLGAGIAFLILLIALGISKVRPRQ